MTPPLDFCRGMCRPGNQCELMTTSDFVRTLQSLALCGWSRAGRRTLTLSLSAAMKESSNILYTQLMTMPYCPKKYNPSSFVARPLLCHFIMIMNCDRMTDFPSCLARRLLCHLILNCDLNTTFSSFEAHICVEQLHQIRGDEGIKYNRSIVHSSKSGSGSILLYLRKQITSCTEFGSDFDQ